MSTVAAENLSRQQPSGDVSTPGHGQGVGPARYKFRVSGTQDIVGGAGANEVSGVPPEAAACQFGATNKKGE